MSSELAVRTEGLTKKFGSFTAVESFDVTVPYGLVIALLGPNGARRWSVATTSLVNQTP
jgi:ABC-2 type transport system ATP-binding protein